jgi:hypothetical protein
MKIWAAVLVLNGTLVVWKNGRTFLYPHKGKGKKGYLNPVGVLAARAGFFKASLAFIDWD